MTKICLACRGKRIRDDGTKEIALCRVCTLMRKSVNTVTAAKGKPKSNLLQKRAVCNTCREKKKACDSNRPCSTCICAKEEFECQYEEGQRLFIQGNSPEGIQLSYTALARRSTTPAKSEEEESLDEPLADVPEFEAFFGLSPQLAQASANPRSPSTLSSTSGSILSFDFSTTIRDDFPSDILPTSSHSADHLSVSSYITGIASGLVPHIQPSPHLNKFLFRTVFLSHRPQLGLCLSEPKLDALEQGDMSGDIIHPVLVHTAQLWGCFLSHWPESEESAQLKAALHALNDDDASLADDPTTNIQARSLLVLYFFAKGDVHRGREQLLKANDVVQKHNLHIVDPPRAKSSDGGESPRNRGEAERRGEQLVALCQLAYIDKCANLILCLPTLLCGEIDQELQILSDINAAACSTSYIVQRARSVFYIQQAKSLSERWDPNDSDDTSSNSWYNEYWDLMRSIHLHQADVKPAMLKASRLSDRGRNVAFRLGHILTLTALAYLHNILATKDIESRRSCFDAVFEVVHATSSISDEDYPIIDPVINICWTFAAEVLGRDQHLNDLGLPKNGFLAMLAVLQRSAEKLKTCILCTGYTAILNKKEPLC